MFLDSGYIIHYINLFNKNFQLRVFKIHCHKKQILNMYKRSPMHYYKYITYMIRNRTLLMHDFLTKCSSLS